LNGHRKFFLDIVDDPARTAVADERLAAVGVQKPDGGGR